MEIPIICGLALLGFMLGKNNTKTQKISQNKMIIINKKMYTIINVITKQENKK